ncbi:hypothetical protein [Fischerella sp. FACHB-380]|uniref:hypothetical protein n=1 Tax=Fischerella sp. FACHB-380 TaxID=2692799 RepID=UPI0016886056|nr:hypothetical protein [Fischerella sp. FACHB-380]
MYQIIVYVWNQPFPDPSQNTRDSTCYVKKLQNIYKYRSLQTQVKRSPTRKAVTIPDRTAHFQAIVMLRKRCDGYRKRTV